MRADLGARGVRARAVPGRLRGGAAGPKGPSFTPCAHLVAPRAQAAPMDHPNARLRRLGRSPWPPHRASARPKAEHPPLSTTARWSCTSTSPPRGAPSAASTTWACRCPCTRCARSSSRATSCRCQSGAAGRERARRGLPQATRPLRPPGGLRPLQSRPERRVSRLEARPATTARGPRGGASALRAARWRGLPQIELPIMHRYAPNDLLFNPRVAPFAVFDGSDSVQAR